MSENGRTNVVFLIDKSGSMAAKTSDVIGGFNEYLKKLQEDGNDYALSIILFDTEVTNLVSGKSPSAIHPLNAQTYVAGGGTALLDAVGDGLKEYKLEDKTLVIIMTDGEENSSKRYSLKEIKANVEQAQTQGQWSFVYLGAGVDAFAEAGGMGISAANTMVYNAATTRATMTATATTAAYYANSDLSRDPSVKFNVTATTLATDQKGNVIEAGYCKHCGTHGSAHVSGGFDHPFEACLPRWGRRRCGRVQSVR
jgi:uncharacterized protein YegL